MPYPYNYLDVSNGLMVSDEGPIDARFLLTKQEMLEIDDNYYMPEVYLTLCLDDGQLYIYNVNNAEDPEVGRFRKFEGDGSTPSADSGPASEMPDPDSSEVGVGDKWYDPETGKTYIVAKDSEGNNAWVEMIPESGEMMYDATNGKILYFDGHEWREVGGLRETSVGTEPVSPQPGDRWLDDSVTPPVLYERGDDNQWHEVTPEKGSMLYDDTNDSILYFNGTEWKPIGGGIEHQSSVDPTSTGEAGEIIFDENDKVYKLYEPGKNGEATGRWLTLAKVWEGTTAEYTALGSNYSTNHPDVICFIKD